MSLNSDTNTTRWHALPAEDALKQLNSNEQGLSGSEVAQRLQQFGRNVLPEARKQPAWLRFLLQFHNVLIYILIAAALATALMQHWIDTIVILAVVVINAVVGFIQEGKAEKALDGIRKMLSLHAIVRRDGEKQDVEADALVPGDVVLLESGDKVPADLRLLEARNLKIEESPLTGESLPVSKKLTELDEKTPLGDRKNMAFSGTMVTSGRGVGVVVATGAATEIGKISELMNSVQSIKTPLLRQIDGFGKGLSIVIGVISALFFAIGFWLRDYPFAEITMAVIGLAVAAIPEGLPAIMTITLAIGVQRMAARKAIIRRLPSVETLGAVTVICSDKTGTLTRNEMTVQSLALPAASYRVTGAGYAPEGEVQDAETGASIQLDSCANLRQLLYGISLCNDSDLIEKDGEWRVRGDPTEGGLRALQQKVGFVVEGHKRLDSIPFESDHKYMATLNEDEERGRIIWLKGAPERILERCASQWGAEGPEDLEKDRWLAAIEEIASRGERVLAVACKPSASDTHTIDHGDVQEGLCFLGLAGMMDPPRPEAIEAVKACRSAGIRVKMITGDHAKTASAIARQLGLENWAEPLSGAELDAMSDDELRKAACKCDVFARTSPENKLRLVEALQHNGEVTAMTGDGVNDAPALKRSDVGIAMGIKGTEVTKDASEMVLADDNFATIARAVKEGRTIYDNLRKAILFILPTNGAQSLVIMLAIAAGMAMPITPVQILWINMVTAVTLAFAFTFEPSEKGVMKRPPRKQSDGILDGLFLWRIGFVSILLAGFSIWFFSNAYQNDPANRAFATTLAVNTLAFGQLFYLFNCRSVRDSLWTQGVFSNRIAWLTAGLLVALQLLFTYAPFMQTAFGTQALPLSSWLPILAAGVVVFIAVEAEKAVLRRFS